MLHAARAARTLLRLLALASFGAFSVAQAGVLAAERTIPVLGFDLLSRCVALGAGAHPLAKDQDAAPRWSAQAGVTSAARPSAGLLPNLTFSAPGLTSGVSLGLVGENIWRERDALSFTISRPIRIYQIPQALVLGIDRNRNMASTLMGESETALLQLAGEVAMQGAYRSYSDGWTTQASLGYSFNAGHIAGRDEVRGLLSFSRWF